MATNRFLQNEGGSNPYALALTTYQGLFAEAFQQKNTLFDSPYIYKSGQGGNGAYRIYHAATPGEAIKQYNPGDRMVGQQIEMTNVDISPEKLVRSLYRIPVDQVKQSPVEMGMKAAKYAVMTVKNDLSRRAAIMGVQAARTAYVDKNGLYVHMGGNRVTRTGASITAAYPRSATGAANFTEDLRSLSLAQDLDGVPSGPAFRSVWAIHQMRDVMQFDTTAKVYSRDYNSVNDIQTRTLRILEGYTINEETGYVSQYNSTNPLISGVMPATDVDASSGWPDRYYGNYSVKSGDTSNGAPVALTLCNGPAGETAVSCGMWIPVTTNSWFDDETLEMVFDAYCQPGFGVSCPWLAGVVEAVSAS